MSDLKLTPAFPTPSDVHGYSYRGLTKREYTAIHLLPVLIENTSVFTNETIIKDTLELTDALLNELEKTSL